MPKKTSKKVKESGNSTRKIMTSKGMQDPKTVLEGFMGKGTAPNPMPGPMHEMPNGHMMPNSKMKDHKKAR